MAKMFLDDHVAIRRLWRNGANSSRGTDAALATRGIGYPALLELAAEGKVESRDGQVYFTESGLAYCREHFGKEAQNAQ